MENKKYSVITVGARCAGTTLTVYLARAGLSVLLLDKDELPSVRFFPHIPSIRSGAKTIDAH